MENQLNDFSEDELYHLIGRSLLRSLPNGWQNVVLFFEFIDEDVWKRSAIVNSGRDGETYISLRTSGTEMNDAFLELARRMEEAGHGKWQKATFTMSRDGKFNIDFSYPEQ